MLGRRRILHGGEWIAERHTIRPSALPRAEHRLEHLAQDVADAGRLGGEVGQRADHLDGRDADAGGERAVEGAFAEAAREAAQDVLAQELAEQVVGQGDAAGGEQVARTPGAPGAARPRKPGRPP